MNHKSHCINQITRKNLQNKTQSSDRISPVGWLNYYIRSIILVESSDNIPPEQSYKWSGGVNGEGKSNERSEWDFCPSPFQTIISTQKCATGLSLSHILLTYQKLTSYVYVKQNNLASKRSPFKGWGLRGRGKSNERSEWDFFPSPLKNNRASALLFNS